MTRPDQITGLVALAALAALLNTACPPRRRAAPDAAAPGSAGGDRPPATAAEDVGAPVAAQGAARANVDRPDGGPTLTRRPVRPGPGDVGRPADGARGAGGAHRADGGARTGPASSRDGGAASSRPQRTYSLPEGTPAQRRSLEAGKTLAFAGSCAEAEPYLEAAAAGALSGPKISALLVLGECYRATNRSQEAVALYERATRLAPAVPEVHAALGRMCLDIGQDGEAIRALGQALALEPRLLAVYLDLGRALVRRGRGAAAAELYLRYEQQLTTLARTALDGSVQERRTAVDALGLVQDEMAQQVLARALQDEDEEVRVLAASALAEAPGPIAEAALRERLKGEPSAGVRVALRQALAARQAAKGLPAPTPGPESQWLTSARAAAEASARKAPAAVTDAGHKAATGRDGGGGRDR